MNLSILMPTYNCGLYISSAIRSMLFQTFKDFEFLIIDDGSEDNTEEIIHSFKDSRIRYIKKEHSGLASSLNYGLNLCTYEWVARMDADDISHPMRLAIQLENIILEVNNVSCTWSIYFKGKRALYSVETPIDENVLKKKMLLHNYICHPSVIYNKNTIMKYGGYKNAINAFEDYEIWLRTMEYLSFKVIDKYLLFMRVRDSSLSRFNYQKHVNIIYSIQRVNSHSRIVNSLSVIEKQILFGWREFFYGSKTRARNEWFGIINNRLFSIRLIIAILLTYLPQTVIDSINRSKLIPCLVSSFSVSNYISNKKLIKTIKNIE